ncbi:sensor histidine kinase [Propionibacterium sp.]|uniref:sensor histidine kinase n=1 Tax=Propionibacterium sp. TaxID=1977903 RepID=UPI0039EB3FCC
MLSMSEVLAGRTSLSAADQSWLASFVREWHLLSDTSFSDLVLWVPDADDNVFWAAAQQRPVTGPTALEDDVVGDDISYEPDSLVVEAYLSRQISETSDNKLQAGIPVDVWAIPIIRHDEVIGIVERHTNQMGVRAPGAMEDCYLEIADILSDMTWRGVYPLEPPSDSVISPRVGDGLVYITNAGVISYASPNAVSAYRRLGLVGDMFGESIEDLTLHELGAEILSVAASGAVGFTTGSPGEFDAQNPDGCIRLRVLPLSLGTHRAGVLVMCRDITELRERERELITKDATIREIHHRVKNNLQTVAALLRLQSRRSHSQEAENALYDAMSRVQSIAAVHEILSQSFDEAADFDKVADKILETVGDVASARGGIRARRQGSFGLVPAKVATSLSLVLTELCQNAIEHGLGDEAGAVHVRPSRTAQGGLVLDVVDEGAGLPEGFVMGSTNSLGTSIVTTLVADMGGEFTLFNNPGGPGATSRVIVPAETLRV